MSKKLHILKWGCRKSVNLTGILKCLYSSYRPQVWHLFWFIKSVKINRRKHHLILQIYNSMSEPIFQFNHVVCSKLLLILHYLLCSCITRSCNIKASDATCLSTWYFDLCVCLSPLVSHQLSAHVNIMSNRLRDRKHLVKLCLLT